MRSKIYYSWILLLLCLSSSFALSQTAGLYTKGNWYLTLNQQMDFKFLSVRNEGEKIHNVYKSHVDMWVCYFLTDHFALDVGYYHSKEVLKNSVDFKDGSDMVYLGGLYGGTVQDVNLQGFAFVGLGASRYMYSEDYTEKSTEIDFMIGLESPISLSGSCNGLLTPRIGFYYSHCSWKGDEGNEMDYPGGVTNSKSLIVDLDVTFFIPRSDLFCDLRQKCSSSSGMYTKGTSLLGTKSLLGFKFGGAKTDYDETDGSYSTDYENTFSSYYFDALYYYYLIENLALGFDVGFSCSGDKFKDSDEKYKVRRFLLTPGIMYNLPADGCLNNLFVNGGIGFGLEREVDTYDDYESKSGNNILAWNLGVGYNYFFTKYLSLTPRLYYDWQSFKPTDSGDNGSRSTVKYTESGLIVAFGLNYCFGGQSEAVRYGE